MKTYKIGNIEINRMGYGGMRLTGKGIFGDFPHREQATELLKALPQNGVNFIDTADSYGPHTNESLIADALAPYPGLMIATKGGLMRPGPDQWTVNGNPEYIQNAIEGSLKRLKTKTIDLWQLHRVDAKVPLKDTLAPVLEAVKAGKIRHVGLSEVGIKEIEEAQKILPIVSVQNIYNLETRQWEAVVDYTREHHIAFIPWFPLGSDPRSFSKEVHQIAENNQATAAQVALAWLLHRSSNIILIPGTSSLSHLKENLKAQDLKLSKEELTSLD